MENCKFFVFFARMKRSSTFLPYTERRYKNYPVVSVGMFVERLFPMEKTSGRGPERHDWGGGERHGPGPGGGHHHHLLAQLRQVYRVSFMYSQCKRLMYSQKWNCVALLIPKQNSNILSSIFHIHVSVSDIYIHRKNRQTIPGKI